jgi:DNA-binding transcriptional ArsR family regulator
VEFSERCEPALVVGRAATGNVLDPLRELSIPPILNHMVQYHSDLDTVFAAVSDATRRGILERLGRRPATISELAEQFGMTLTGMKKHVSVLEDAGLVKTEKVGRVRTCTLGTRRLADEAAWIRTYHEMLDARFDSLGEFLERTRGDQP